MARGAGGAAGKDDGVVKVAALKSVDAIRERVASAAKTGLPVRVTGRGTWLDAGRPVRATESLSLRDLSGITEYVPGDLTLTARAGTTLDEIRDATGEHGQWLALDPAGAGNGTLGATVATASAGPLRTSFGSPRDLVLGIEFVTGGGVVARAGGRVVKNVAGFDISRLMTGAWGTLGVITEVTVRLHARPEADETVSVAIDNAAHVARARGLLRAAAFTPYACEILNDTLARALLGADAATAVFRLGGNAESVRAQRDALADLGTVRDADPAVWAALRGAEPPNAIVFRLSRLPSEVERTWSDAAAVAAACPGTLIHASPSRGVARCIVPPSDASARFLATWFSRSNGGARIGERLPAALWPACARRSCRRATGCRKAIRRAFDPRGVLNPGILGDA